MDDITFNSNAPWTIGPTQAWVEAINKGIILQIGSKEYSSGRGICWGKYLK